jgi:exodeoxyribonuclease V gamma subunit
VEERVAVSARTRNLADVLHVHRSERSDALVAPLADVLAEPPDDPFTPDVVAVPTRGIERWLAQRLSHRLGVPGPAGASSSGAGICANVDFSSPSRLVASAVTAVTGVEPDDDPWRRARLVWPVLDLLDGTARERHLRLPTSLVVRASTAPPPR